MNAVVSDFPWGSYNRILDVGGAHGSVLAALMEANPTAEGVLFDLPDVISRARQVQGNNLYSNLNYINWEERDLNHLMLEAPAARSLICQLVHCQLIHRFEGNCGVMTEGDLHTASILFSSDTIVHAGDNNI